jgi:hypothetical protein
MSNWKAYEKKWSWPNQDNIPTFVCRDWGNRPETSMRTAGVPVEVQTEHLPNTNLKPLPLDELVTSLCTVLSRRMGKWRYTASIHMAFSIFSYFPYFEKTKKQKEAYNITLLYAPLKFVTYGFYQITLLSVCLRVFL